MNEAEIRQGLRRFCESWNKMIPLLRGNHLVEPLLNRKINLAVGSAKYLLTLTPADASLTEGEDPFANASFSADTDAWNEMLHGQSNFLTLAMQKRMTTTTDESLVHLRLSILIQLLSLMSQAAAGEE
jgi:putative sterol carrier protein